eukprot:CAMPEP_0203762824 /NCGR_PEP_ID=MMETSP0098-20131031/15618_1 /ASSEMBLY_ACC=CAM_ASM_000208 /TAXON_ID=96639 /ORGANISM=" , Strain NY0313808BC1" /LENGTH=473 /DNA_ID=CAMNT_0050657381 /DNA_START=95 /DNA_END=1516 /DNA_ORIENTATION=+
MTIGGASVGTNGTFGVVNPFTGKVFAQAPQGGKVQLDQAVTAARGAFPNWARTPWSERQQALKKCAELLAQNKKEVSQLLCLEQGKPLGPAMGEVLGACAWLKMASKHSDPTKVLRETGKDKVIQLYKPIGVCGCITAWNYPVILLHFKIAQALLAGCTVVVKPSEHTPLTTLEIVRLYNSVLPPGVLNVVTSDSKDLGRMLVEHPGVDKISFTGSTQTGKAVLRGATDSLKRVTLELGGNDAAVILADVDPKKVAPYIFRASFQNSGQVCMAVKRIYVHESIADDFCRALAEEAERASFGDGMSKGVTYGPINNAMQYEKVREILVAGLSKGAKIVYGEVPPPLQEGKGYLFHPVIVTNVDKGNPIVDEEQFGPIVPIVRFGTTEEAIAKANDTIYGLGGSVWTDDMELGVKLASELDAGTTWVNNHGDIVDDVPFGGAKSSGIGSEGGHEGLLAFMQMQVVKIKKPSLSRI